MWKVVHPEEIRSKMLEEAEDVLRRYDQLLPVENRMWVLPLLTSHIFPLEIDAVLGLRDQETKTSRRPC